MAQLFSLGSMSASSQNSSTDKTKRRLIWVGVFVALCVLGYAVGRQTIFGEMIRAAFKGVPPAQLWADDLADDVRAKSRLASLQDWSVQTLARYRTGQLATNGRSSFSGPFAVRLASQEVPSWLSGAWSGQKPEISVLLNFDSKEPECIVVGWYLCGLRVGAPSYTTDFHPFYIVQVKPGIYAYSLEK